MFVRVYVPGQDKTGFQPTVGQDKRVSLQQSVTRRLRRHKRNTRRATFLSTVKKIFAPEKPSVPFFGLFFKCHPVLIKRSPLQPISLAAAIAASPSPSSSVVFKRGSLWQWLPAVVAAGCTKPRPTRSLEIAAAQPDGKVVKRRFRPVNESAQANVAAVGIND